jgi:hypothetical protein
MDTRAINRVSRIALALLSTLASVTVFQAVIRALLAWQVPPPAEDEGTAAHIFQLALVALLPVSLVFVTTMDWKQPWRSLRPVILPAAALVIAIAIILYMEKIYYPGHYLTYTR